MSAKRFCLPTYTMAKGTNIKCRFLLESLAANRQIYSVGMGCSIDEMQDKWDEAIKNPITPKFVDAAPCHEMIEKGVTLSQEG